MSTDNSAQIKMILANSVLKGDANFEKRSKAIQDIKRMMVDRAL